MRRERIVVGDRVWWVGPQEGDRNDLMIGDPRYGDPKSPDPDDARPIGSTGKVYGLERGVVYVSWGGGEEGWQPRSYLMTFREWQRRVSLACGRWQHEVPYRLCECDWPRAYHADFFDRANRGLPVGGEREVDPADRDREPPRERRSVDVLDPNGLLRGLLGRAER